MSAPEAPPEGAPRPAVTDDALDGTRIPRLGRGVRLRVDRVNHKHLLLRPEQGFELRGAALDIVRLCDGRRSVDDIVARLCETFAGADSGVPDVGPPPAPPPARIAADVRKLLAQLAARRLIELTP